MINILVLKENQNILTIETTGHAGFAKHDIVCSAVSTLTQSLLNGLTDVVCIKPKVILDEDSAHLSITIPKDLSKEKFKESQILMKTTYLALTDLEDSFKKFIKIKEKQV